MYLIDAYTDGACSGNPGPGGWAIILVSGSHRHEDSGYELDTTNNRMELMAAIKSLAAITDEDCEVNLYTDSQYIVDAMNKGWIQNWIKNGWKNANRKPVANQDLWEQILEQTSRFQVSFKKVPGHAGHKFNELVDTMAQREAQKAKKML